MSKLISYILSLSIIIILFHFTGIAYSQGNSSENINYCDSVNFSIRKPSLDKIANYKLDKELQYKEDSPPVTQSWLQKILYWIAKMIAKIFKTVAENAFLMYVFFIALAVFLILKISNTKLQSLFFKKRDVPKSIIFHELEEDINNINFDELIAREIEQKNFRRAVRLLYLKLLKLLDDKDLIKWQNDKTNYQYFLELNKTKFADEYKNLSVLYEFIWYGNFNIEDDKFNNIHKLFNKYINRVNE